MCNIPALLLIKPSATDGERNPGALYLLVAALWLKRMTGAVLPPESRSYYLLQGWF